MSNEYKDWLADFSKEQKKNYELCMKYPILIPTNRWTGKTPDDYMYEYTELDGMPEGWKIAFGEQWAEDIQKAINKFSDKEKDMIRIMDIKEKFGFLHTYFSYYTEELDKVITNYERLSKRTCILCGAPATKVSQRWISPYCDDCADKISKYECFVSVDEWFKEGKDE